MEPVKAIQVMLFAGGVIRDCNNNMVGAFAEYFGLQTSVFTEPKAILLGLTFAKWLGLPLVWIETNSLRLVNILNYFVDVSCTIFYIIQDIRKLAT